jgi:hypothetical protein
LDSVFSTNLGEHKFANQLSSINSWQRCGQKQQNALAGFSCTKIIEEGQKCPIAPGVPWEYGITMRYGIEPEMSERL